MATLPAITPKDDAEQGELILAADFNSHADAINTVNEAYHERLPDGYRSLAGAAALLVTDNLVDGDTTSGSFTLTLPAAADVPAGWRVKVVKIVAANTLTVQRAGADTINGATSKAWAAQWLGYVFVSDGVNEWRAFPALPISAPAYTQTYSTADRTLSAYTPDSESAAYTGAADSEAKLADLNALRVAVENLRAFVEDIAGVVNSHTDDLQALGIFS